MTQKPFHVTTPVNDEELLPPEPPASSHPPANKPTTSATTFLNTTSSLPEGVQRRRKTIYFSSSTTAMNPPQLPRGNAHHTTIGCTRVTSGWSSPSALRQPTLFSTANGAVSSSPLVYSNQHPPTRIKKLHDRIPSSLCASKQSSTSVDSEQSDSPEHPPFISALNEQLDILVEILGHSSTTHGNEVISSMDEIDDDSISNESIEILQSMMSLYTWHLESKEAKSSFKFMASSIIDKAFRLVTSDAFDEPYHLGKVNMGMKALQLQLHPESSGGGTPLMALGQPYNTIPRGTWLRALRALTSSDINYSRSSSSLRSVMTLAPNDEALWITPSDAAFRILQRLVTGKGVRSWNAKKKNTQHKSSLDERDFNMVLHSYAGLAQSQMHSAHRVMALQKRTPHAPHLSPVAYSILLKAYGRLKDIENARKLIDYVTNMSLPASKRGRRLLLTPTYNAFISGLLSDNWSGEKESTGQSSYGANILEALNMLQEMQDLNIHPNIVTVTLLIDGLGNCNPPRCKEAKELVQHLEYTIRTKQTGNIGRGDESKGSDISMSNVKIATALIRAFGRGNDVDSAIETFKRIPNPDVVALNALLDACCRCSQFKLALDMFNKYASFENWRDNISIIDIGPLGEEILHSPIRPDVVTYTSLISAILQLNNKAATKRATKLYNEMKQTWWISPDTVLVDTILCAMTSGGQIGFEAHDVQFTLAVLRDGERLEWEDGQYEKRKKAVRSILVGFSSEVWKNDEYGFGLMSEREKEDPLFLKKGWNRIDSGFRLWGGGDVNESDEYSSSRDEADSSVDSFLASKGWNDIDSGFRLL
ncbi:predicted protein [Thalassiosira pseudonana CCMP1335]|uniref:Pentacotripeptide-repeat region of PRORP domain-containing protein n=1 Tax=Thalassiosira pseudonana TaxID=35128 RepID=B8CAF4_THAPS|nr:predicted protein [Thalassiosira pseudonana CCMP1335]EED89499.1 predicted protein [Thalassiosira pseudonana CCMP1335]